MVIEIKIKAIGDKVFDKLTMRETTLIQNAMVIRRLEKNIYQMKLNFMKYSKMMK